MEKIIGVGGGAMSRTTTGRWVIRGTQIAPAASIRRYGDLACRDDQAAVALEVGDVICTAYGPLDGPDITCLRVVALNGLEAITEAVNGDGRGYPAAWEYPSEGLDTYHNRDGGMFARLPASAWPAEGKTMKPIYRIPSEHCQIPEQCKVGCKFADRRAIKQSTTPYCQYPFGLEYDKAGNCLKKRPA